MSTLRSDSALALLGQALSELATLLSHLLLVLLLVLFLLVDTVDLSERMKTIRGDTQVDVQRFSRIAEEVKQYLVLKTYLCLLTGLVVWVVLTLTGVDFAPLWALLSVLLGYIPNIGPLHRHRSARATFAVTGGAWANGRRISSTIVSAYGDR